MSILWRLGAVLFSALLLTVPALAQTIAPDGPTLAAVRARGHLVCAGTDPLPGFAQLNAEGRWVGFDVDFCRAVAAAVFGDPSAIEFRPLSGEGRFCLLYTSPSPRDRTRSRMPSSA